VESVREQLRNTIQELCLETGRFTLSTGQVSDYYFDCKPAMLEGSVLNQIAAEMIAEADRMPVPATAVGGLSIGADFLVSAIILLAAQQHHPMARGCVVRKDPKAHGTRNVIENKPDQGAAVLVVDDVFTTGQSTAHACTEIMNAGAQIVGIVGLIDREQGATPFLREKFRVPVVSLFKSSDFSVLANRS
jgi:orotate phosphoribosyltransferase